jgi:hypothetical protein
MLFALPSYQFPYIVMNRCLYLMQQRDHLRDRGIVGLVFAYLTHVPAASVKLKAVQIITTWHDFNKEMAGDGGI